MSLETSRRGATLVRFRASYLAFDGLSLVPSTHLALSPHDLPALIRAAQQAAALLGVAALEDSEFITSRARVPGQPQERP